jgi:hypothetical protein
MVGIRGGDGEVLPKVSSAEPVDEVLFELGLAGVDRDGGVVFQGGSGWYGECREGDVGCWF